MELNKGQHVVYRGRVCLVENVAVRGMKAPYARLSDVESGEAIEEGQLISHVVLQKIPPATQP